MGQDLLELVGQDLLPVLRPLGFEVMQAETADSFDNASVVLQSKALRVRIVRERSLLFADFGPSSEPNTWFDSAVVIDYLGLSAEAGFHGRNSDEVLRGIGKFVSSLWDELQRVFDHQHVVESKRVLTSLKEARAARLFEEP
jgi:hypothetical protein